MTNYSFDKAEHVHKYGDELLTGTTTALSILQPTLTYWASGLACSHMGWFNENPSSKGYVKPEIGMQNLERRFNEIKQLTPQQYKKELDIAYKAHSAKLKDAGKKGTSTHSLVEDYINAVMKREPYVIPKGLSDMQNRQLTEFIEWASQNVKKFLFSEVCTYSIIHKVGGICDFGYVDMYDRTMLGDIKTGSDIYDNYFIQMGAYDLQLSENGGFTHSGSKIISELKIEGYTVVNLPKEGSIKVGHRYDRELQQKAFLSALFLFRHLKK